MQNVSFRDVSNFGCKGAKDVMIDLYTSGSVESSQDAEENNFIRPTSWTLGGIDSPLCLVDCQLPSPSRYARCASQETDSTDDV